MGNWHNIPQSDKLILLQETANRDNLSQNIVEKDWWVTVILRALTLSSCKDAFSFKGGTSLSKGWRLIERFSEDIDIAIHQSFWGIERDNKNQRDKLRKASRKYIHENLVPELTGILHSWNIYDFEMQYVQSDDSDKDPTVVLIPYQSLVSSMDEYMKSVVKIEFSCRSLKEPCEIIPIKSLISQAFPGEDDENDCMVRTVVPTRTFLEKIFLLHEEYQKNYPRSRRMTRHLYDLVALMDTDFGRTALEDTEMYKEIVRHRSIYTAMRGIDYAGHIPSNIRIVPPDAISNAWQSDYESMRQTFFYGESPDFATLIEKIEQLQERIRQIPIDEI